MGYGSMLVEAALAALVIVAVAGGLGMGLVTEDGSTLTGTAAFSAHYASWAAASGLAAKLKAFITGSANLISSFGVPVKIAIAVMGVFLVSFAATTLDSAARIQRYVVSELGKAYSIKPLTKRHPATIYIREERHRTSDPEASYVH